MKRVITYAAMFCISLILMCFTINSLNWLFWASFAVFALSCYLMERDKKQCEGEIDDLDDIDVNI